MFMTISAWVPLLRSSLQTYSTALLVTFQMRQMVLIWTLLGLDLRLESCAGL
jgi:hypothetical protein